MTLDLGPLSRQVAQMGQALKQTSADLAPRLALATEALRQASADFEALRRKAEASRTPWPLARPRERPDAVYGLPPGQADYMVVATDGSQIEPDRHGRVLCHLVNIGWAALRYGDKPWAWLDSEPRLYYDDADLYLNLDGVRVLVSGHLLDAKRNLAEIERLVAVAEKVDRGVPTVGLQDGTLVLRALEGWPYREYIRRTAIPRFLEQLARLQTLGVPVGGYISRPRSYEVVGLLRVASCPHPVPDCRQLCAGLAGQEPCAGLAGLVDRLVMSRLLLQPGDRSALFITGGGMDGSPIYFCYLNVGSEIARLELPDWVASHQEYLELVHWMVYDQCRRGGGYPRVLIEAHEKAVLTVADRQQFEILVDAALARLHLPERTSAKERSKRVRSL